MLSDAEISRRTTETSGIVSRSETLSKMQSTTIRDTARFGKETREKSERSSATLSFLSLPSWNREIFDGKNKVTLLRLIIIIIFNYFFLNIRISFFSLSFLLPVVPKIWTPFWTSTRICWRIQRVKRSRSRRATLYRRGCTGCRVATDQRTLTITRGKGSRTVIDANPAGSSRIRCTRSWRIYCTRVRTTIYATNILDRWRIVTRRRVITWGTSIIRWLKNRNVLKNVFPSRRLTNVNFFLFLCKTRVGRPRGRRLVVHEGEIEIQLGREAREQEEDGFGGRRGGKSERAREKENRSAAE